MREALEEAKKAYAENEVPVGAVVVYKNRIIAKAYNQKLKLNDFRAHAEVIALNKAQKVIGDWRLNDCKLFVTKEPCPMCAGATIVGRIKEIYYAFDDPKMGAMGGATSLHELPRSNHKPKVFSGILKDECLQLTQAFFQLRRKDQSSKPE